MAKMSKEGQANFKDMLDRAGIWFNKQVPNATNRAMITHGLAGAGLGAAGLGGAAWLRDKDKDEDERASVLLPMLAGALGGGAAGVGIGKVRSEGLLPSLGLKDVMNPADLETKKLNDAAQAYADKKYTESPFGWWERKGTTRQLATVGTGAAGIYGVGKVRSDARHIIEEATKKLQARELAGMKKYVPPSFSMGTVPENPLVGPHINNTVAVLSRETNPTKFNSMIDKLLLSKHPGTEEHNVLLSLKDRYGKSMDEYTKRIAAEEAAHNLANFDKVKDITLDSATPVAPSTAKGAMGRLMERLKSDKPIRNKTVASGLYKKYKPLAVGAGIAGVVGSILSGNKTEPTE